MITQVIKRDRQAGRLQRPKIIAFYLPQYHSFPENDKWWGEGFTEWTNVRNSRPQFKGHLQPEVPLGGDYYNLLNSDVQERQAKIAHEYNVYGFCYYHYWFSGKLLMEKPMENMLKNPAVDQPFCVCWANEHWTRNWDGQNKKIIMHQNYDENPGQWEEHFNYLLPFFRDSRYIKHDGKPVFIIYKPFLIKNCSEMLAFWNELAIKAGFPGMYIGFQFPDSFNYDYHKFDFGIAFEPLYTEHEFVVSRSKCRQNIYAATHFVWAIKKIWNLMNRKLRRIPDIHDYDEYWNRIIKRPPDSYIMPGAFTAWDNTPRRGREASVWFESTPAKFQLYMHEALRRADKAGSEFFFINAWNEWGEGAHLEPDEHNGYGYLEGVREAVQALDNESNTCQ